MEGKSGRCAGGLLATVLVATALGAGLIPASAGAFTQTFTTPGSQPFLVPDGVTRVSIDAFGARGGDALNGIAANGAEGLATGIAVTPGETLTVVVGGHGGDGTYGPCVAGSAGSNGGGAGGGCSGSFNGEGGGGGGGATEFLRGADALLVAAGGGGAGGDGGTAGSGGQSGTDGDGDRGGTGATPTTFGVGGSGVGNPGGDGSAGQGGAGGESAAAAAGGGGGGGVFGGGGGGAGGFDGTYLSGGAGGGGSSMGPAGTTFTTGADAANSRNGKVVISYGLATSLTTNATSANVGQPIHDSGTLADGHSPTGTINFRAYGPGDTSCTGTVAFDSGPIAVSDNGEYGSGDFVPAAAGTYEWRADYSGDADNDPASSACNAAGESSTVGKASPTLTTAASPDVILGGALNDTATIASGVDPTGTITFKLYGPDDASCSSATPGFTNNITVSGNGDYPSGNFTPTEPGAYRWTADYSGDANNAPVAGACNDAGESSVVSAAAGGQTPPAASPNCEPLRKKLKRQKHGLGAAASKRKHTRIKGNIVDTKRRLRKRGC
jgi:hypothetical protein